MLRLELETSRGRWFAACPPHVTPPTFGVAGASRTPPWTSERKKKKVQPPPPWGPFLPRDPGARGIAERELASVARCRPMFNSESLRDLPNKPPERGRTA